MSLQAPLRTLHRPSSICRQCLSRLRNPSLQVTRTSVTLHEKTKVRNVSGQRNDEELAQNLPRWAATPSAMKAPYKVRPDNDNDYFPVNENPQKLDEMYIRLLGPDGHKWLDEGLKWLAVTHKSFDHGRRGFNERLGWLGRRMVYLQASYALLNTPPMPEVAAARKKKDSYGRVPFQDPALAGIEGVSYSEKTKILDDVRVGHMAQRQYGMEDVLRWKPRQIRELQISGAQTCTAEALYAVVGAIALSKGGTVANEVIKDKVLTPMMGIAPL